jgi:hypothetical protein
MAGSIDRIRHGVVSRLGGAAELSRAAAGFQDSAQIRARADLVR